jgi:hypothetical protein
MSLSLTSASPATATGHEHPQTQRVFDSPRLSTFVPIADTDLEPQPNHNTNSSHMVHINDCHGILFAVNRSASIEFPITHLTASQHPAAAGKGVLASG